MAKRWWDDEDGVPLSDELPSEPAASNLRREAEPPRPALRRRELLDVGGPVEEVAAVRSEAERQARVDAAAAMLVREYEAAGLAPFRDGTGMLVSLSLLLRMGWTIGDDGRGGKVLLQPPESANPGSRE